MQSEWNKIGKMAAEADKKGLFKNEFNDEPGLLPIAAQNYKSENIGTFDYENL